MNPSRELSLLLCITLSLTHVSSVPVKSSEVGAENIAVESPKIWGMSPQIDNVPRHDMRVGISPTEIEQGEDFLGRPIPLDTNGPTSSPAHGMAPATPEKLETQLQSSWGSILSSNYAGKLSQAMSYLTAPLQHPVINKLRHTSAYGLITRITALARFYSQRFGRSWTATRAVLRGLSLEIEHQRIIQSMLKIKMKFIEYPEKARENLSPFEEHISHFHKSWSEAQRIEAESVKNVEKLFPEFWAVILSAHFVKERVTLLEHEKLETEKIFNRYNKMVQAHRLKPSQVSAPELHFEESPAFLLGGSRADNKII